MEFADILPKFEVHDILTVESSILGQKGYLFVLDHSVAYLYEETRGDGFAVIFINGSRIELSNKERQKLHSMLRLQGASSRLLKTRDLWVYSKLIEDAIHDLLDERPDIVKGSTHMAFAPKNYTRFSENLVFDFDYLYDDIALVKEIESFASIFEKQVNSLPHLAHELSDQFSDDQLYRHLLKKKREFRISINGQISMPEFLVALFEYTLTEDTSRICIDMGPTILYLRTDQQVRNMMERSNDKLLDSLNKQEYLVLSPDRNLMIDILYEIDHVLDEESN